MDGLCVRHEGDAHTRCGGDVLALRGTASAILIGPPATAAAAISTTVVAEIPTSVTALVAVTEALLAVIAPIIPPWRTVVL
jgi:hypothetical protein